MEVWSRKVRRNRESCTGGGGAVGEGRSSLWVSNSVTGMGGWTGRQRGPCGLGQGGRLKGP